MTLQKWMLPGDLAPGDAKSLGSSWEGLSLHHITSRDEPLFDVAFGALWAEFGHVAEIEEPEVLAKRMAWNSDVFSDGACMQYCLMLATRGEEFVAVRDHTAMLLEDEPGATVHLSHNLVAPSWRRSGIAGWMRALPITTARSLLARHGRPSNSPITLVGEMESFDADRESSLVRLKAYEHAGFRKVDPRGVHYQQPDFRPAQQIDLDGTVRPLSLDLVIRRVGHEEDDVISGSEVMRIVRSLYKMYGRSFRAKDMAIVEATLADYPDADAAIRLLPPTCP